METTFIAKTARGAPIQVFGDRKLAMRWADEFGHLFPGYLILRVDRVVVEKTITIRRDRSHLECAA